MPKKLFAKYKSQPVQVRATAWFFICSVLQRGISTITTPIFTRLLTPAEYGQFAVFNSWLSIVQIVATLSLSSGVYTMGLVKFREEEKIFTSSLQGLNFVLCLFWTLVYLAFHDVVNRAFSLTTVQMFSMLVMIWSSAAFSFWMTTQRNRFKYRNIVAVTLVLSVLKPAIGVFFVTHAEDKVTARILGLALVELVCYTGFFFYQLHEGKTFFSAKYWKYAVLFNLPLVPHYLAGRILSSSDRIMILHMVDESSAGIYSLAYSLSLVMTMVNDSLNKSMSPYLYQKVREKRYSDMAKVVYPSLIFVAIANLLMIAIAPEIIRIFAPPEYSEAIYVVPPVAMSALASYLYLCFAPFEFYFEKRSWTTISTFTSAAVNVGLNLVFIRLFGYQAAGYTTLFCSALNSFLHYHFMRRVCKTYLDNVKPYNPRVLILISVVCLAIGFMYIPLYSTPILRYIVTAVLVLLVFIARKKFMPVIMPIIRRKK